MNLVLLYEDDFCDAGKRVRLMGRRLEHVRAIHRAEVGDVLTVGLLNGEIGKGRIVDLNERSLDMEVRLDHAPPPALPLTLVLALPRPLVLKRVLIAATSMGIKRIFLLNAHSVEKSFWQSRAMSDESIATQLHLGLEQARDTLMPEVVMRPRFKPFVVDELPALVGDGLALVAHPGVEADCPRRVDCDVVLAVGPESGWNVYELDLLEAGGFRAVSLGERSLRVETAIPALVSRLF
jgi:RsmE family RNA methyltransferase